MGRLIGMGMIALMITSGCTPQEQAQRALIAEMRQGITDLRSWQSQRQDLVDGFYRQRRQTLDDAFDADVRAAGNIEPEWVIEARVAYAAAMEANWKAQAASAMSEARASENLAAIDEGLQHLAWISELRQN